MKHKRTWRYHKVLCGTVLLLILLLESVFSSCTVSVPSDSSAEAVNVEETSVENLESDVDNVSGEEKKYTSETDASENYGDSSSVESSEDFSEETSEEIQEETSPEIQESNSGESSVGTGNQERSEESVPEESSEDAPSEESSEDTQPEESNDTDQESESYVKILPDKMPVLTINTEEHMEVVSRDVYVTCSISSSNCDEQYQFTDSAGGIRVRGNASSNYGNVEWIRQNKVHYRIKFDSKQSMFGLNDGAKCKSWVLLRGDGNYAKEEIPFYLFRRLSGGKYYSSDYMFVRVILNGDDIGAYVLCEQNQINKYRIAIDEQKDGETYLNTGYLMELENYPAGEEYLIQLNYNGGSLTDPYGVTMTPNTANISVKNNTMTSEQLTYLKTWINSIYTLCYRAIVKGEYCRIREDGILVRDYSIHSARECIENYVALDSVVWTYILEEFAIELDVGVGSFFFYIDFSVEQPQLTFAAPWDYSWAFLSSYGFTTETLGVGAWQTSDFISYAGNRSNPWFILFYQADWFREYVSQEWKRMRDEQMFEDLFTEMHWVSKTYKEDFDYTKTRWNETLQVGACNQLINWMNKRIKFLDSLWLEGDGLPEVPEKRENIADKATYEVHDFFRFGTGYQYSEDGEIVYGDSGNDLTDGKHASQTNFKDEGWVGLNKGHPNAELYGQYVLFEFDQSYAIDSIYISVSNMCTAGIYAPLAITAYWSDDGINWSTEGIAGDYTTELASGTTVEYKIEVNQSAKFWKLVISFSEHGWCFMDEIEFTPAKQI